jgi:hypothetical protein
MSTTRQTAITLWHYTCPECGVGDGDTGYHAPTHAIYCEVCLEDNRHVRLKRWPADDNSTTLMGGALGGG